MYTVASPDPKPKGGGQPNPNQCYSTLTSGTNKHLLVFLAPNIIFIGQMEKDIGRGIS